MRHIFGHTTTEVEQSTSIPQYKTEITCTCGWSAVRFTADGCDDARSKHMRARNSEASAPCGSR